MGEVFAGLGLGLLPVVGTALVQHGTIGPAAWAAGIPAFLMTFDLLLLNEFPDEKADQAGGRLNLVLLLGRPRAALRLRLRRLWRRLSAIVIAVLAKGLPPLALVGCLPFWFAVPAVRWAAGASRRARCQSRPWRGNVVWNIIETNALLGGGPRPGRRSTWTKVSVGASRGRLAYYFSASVPPKAR